MRWIRLPSALRFTLQGSQHVLQYYGRGLAVYEFAAFAYALAGSPESVLRFIGADAFILKYDGYVEGESELTGDVAGLDRHRTVRTVGLKRQTDNYSDGIILPDSSPDVVKQFLPICAFEPLQRTHRHPQLIANSEAAAFASRIDREYSSRGSNTGKLCNTFLIGSLLFLHPLRRSKIIREARTYHPSHA